MATEEQRPGKKKEPVADKADKPKLKVSKKPALEACGPLVISIIVWGAAGRLAMVRFTTTAIQA